MTTSPEPALLALVGKQNEPLFVKDLRRPPRDVVDAHLVTHSSLDAVDEQKRRIGYLGPIILVEGLLFHACVFSTSIVALVAYDETNLRADAWTRKSPEGSVPKEILQTMYDAYKTYACNPFVDFDRPTERDERSDVVPDPKAFFEKVETALELIPFDEREKL